jgi:putative addiction module CopG family antidote
MFPRLPSAQAVGLTIDELRLLIFDRILESRSVTSKIQNPKSKIHNRHSSFVIQLAPALRCPVTDAKTVDDLVDVGLAQGKREDLAHGMRRWTCGKPGWLSNACLDQRQSWQPEIAGPGTISSSSSISTSNFASGSSMASSRSLSISPCASAARRVRWRWSSATASPRGNHRLRAVEGKVGGLAARTVVKPSRSRSGQNPAADYDPPMTVTLPPALNQLVDRLVHTGRYADEGDVVRQALRVLERQEFDESPALEAAILEGVHSPHQRYDASVMDRIRQNARSIA